MKYNMTGIMTCNKEERQEVKCFDGLFSSSSGYQPLGAY